MVTAGATAISKFLGLVPLLPMAWLTIVVASPQGSWDELVVGELGKSYLYQQRLCDGLPLICSALTWLSVVLLLRRPKLEAQAS